MTTKPTNRSSGAMPVAALLAAVTILASFGSFQMISSREVHLRRMITQALTVGRAPGTGQFELQAGTLATVRPSADGKVLAGQIHWQTRFAAFGDTTAWIIILGLPTALVFCFAVGFGILRTWVIAPLYRENQALATQAAATRSMQMFAHDIRKPFSALKAVTQVLQQNKAPEEAAAIARKLLPEVDSLLAHVDQMISDILQNETNRPVEYAGAIDSILEAAVRETSRKHPKAAHRITWQLRHSLQADVSAPALTRAVANLLCNAVEAMGPEDEIRISTEDTADSGIALTVTNSGPVIPPEILARLFTPFFTSGKKGGTGLGLAYVRSLVDECGGTVKASSDAVSGTSFRVTLPAARSLDKPTVSLPAQLNEAQQRHSPSRREQPPAAPRHVLIVEDNDCYAEALQAAFSENGGVSTWTLSHVRSAAEALEHLKKRPDILICDIDLGPDSDSGLHVIAVAAKLTRRPAIYVHSNTVLSPADRRHLELLADGFLAKPVSAATVAALISAQQEVVPRKKPVVAVIDDDCFVRELWSMQQEEVTTILFDSPDQFLAAVAADPELVPALTAVIVDYYFENCPGYTGDMLARSLRSEFNVPVIMSSDASGLAAETIGLFDLIVSKDCISWAAIADRIRQPA